MKKKTLLSIAVVLTLAFAALLAWSSFERNGSSAEQFDENAQASNAEDSKTASTSTKRVEQTRINDPPNATANSVPALVQKPLYQLAQTTSSFDPEADAKRRENLPFRMFASGGAGKIVDAAGNVIAKSDSTNAIFGCEVSPDQKRIAIKRGSGKYDVLTPSTGETIRLPQLPPGENVLAFSWDWIDDDTLVGVSGKVIPFRDDETGPEREEPNISQSTLYVYKLSERKLAEVELPTELQNKTFSVSAVDLSGNVQLRPEDHESYADGSLGWFDVSPKDDT